MALLVAHPVALPDPLAAMVPAKGTGVGESGVRAGCVRESAPPGKERERLFTCWRGVGVGEGRGGGGGGAS
jgi:hypothetical protein